MRARVCGELTCVPPPSSYVGFLTPGPENVTILGNRSTNVIIVVKLRSHCSWVTLIPYNWVLIKGDMWTCMQEDAVGRQNRDGVMYPQAKEQRGRQQPPGTERGWGGFSLMVSRRNQPCGTWGSSLQNWERTDFYWLSCPILVLCNSSLKRLTQVTAALRCRPHR